MDYSAYLSKLSSYRQTELNEREKSFLFKIMSGHYSAFKITSYIKARRQPIAYKDEYTTLKRLQQLNLIEEEEAKFLRGTVYYKLTTVGLFYILTNMSSYPPTLLTRYQDNILLKTLLYPYIEIGTIRSCTAHLYSVITRYLKECCEITIHTLHDIKGAISSEHSERYVNGLQFDLEWQAKVLGFQLAIMYSESNILRVNPDVANDNSKVAFYELESTMKLLLSKDDRFMHLIREVEKEFSEGYKEILELKGQ